MSYSLFICLAWNLNEVGDINKIYVEVW
jgi:hypothetical protein